MKEPRRPGAVRALALLLALNTLCYLDRYILAAVEPEIRHAFFAPDDPDAMAKTGALATAFLVSYMILAPLFGWLADKHSRWAIIGAGAAVWSLATAGSGWAPTFGILLAARILVGTGEAAYGPAAPTLLSDLFPPARLGLVLAWFFAAIPFGSAVGYLFGGAMAGAFGWRAPFHFAAIPGLVLAGLCLLIKDKRPAGKARRRATIEDYRGLMRIPSYLYNVGAQTAMTFAIGGMSFWAPAYFYEQRGQADLERVNLTFGGITAVAGLIGHRPWGLARRLVGEAFHRRLLPRLWLRDVAGVPVHAGDAVYAISSGVAVLLPRRLFPFLQYWPGEYRDCQRDETRGSGDCICGGNFHHARLGRCHLASADWSCRRSVESQYRFSGGFVYDADSGPALAGGCEISRLRCSESCAPMRISSVVHLYWVCLSASFAHERRC